MQNKHLTKIAFGDFDLDPQIQQGLQDAGFEFCTPIQAKTLPITLAGHDVAGQAQTGTGKTAAFLIALMQQLLSQKNPKRRQPRALILAPTRELAIQIHKDASLLSKHCDLKLGLAYGGTDYHKQRDEIAAGVDILIGTPGRLIDYFKQKVYNLRQIKVMVLDEADRMFDLGFIKDIRFIMRRLPPVPERISLLFSATLSHRVMELAYEHMNNPERIHIKTENVTAENIEQGLYFPANPEKLPLLLGLMQKHEPTRAIVFTNTKHMAHLIYRTLNHHDIKARLLSGNVQQDKRTKVIEDFKKNQFKVLVATDVASRGLHVDDVTHVFNFDLPDDAEDYVHRIGRTARAGAEGVAFSFACEEYAMNLPAIEDYVKAKIPVLGLNEGDFATLKPLPPKPKSAHNKKRPSHKRRRRPARK